MLKRNKRFLILLVGILFLLSGCNSINTDQFDGDNAYNHIKELSLDKYEGRMTGSEGNKLAAEYIANEFEKYGLKPGGADNTYFQSFDIRVPKINNVPKFQVVDNKGNIVIEYKHRQDFYEATYDFAGGGKVKGKFELKNSTTLESNEDNSIILMNEAIDYKIGEKLVEAGVKAVITPSKYAVANKKSIALGNKKGLKAQPKFIHLRVTQEIFDDLVNYSKEGYKINIDFDLTFEMVKANNVIGYIEGSNENLKEEVLLITAHYDHVGVDPDKTVFNGALDNASGVGTIMEIARLSSQSKVKPQRSIIFIAFDGEESGLQGSYYYTRHQLISTDKYKVINVDMVGSKENVPLEIHTSVESNPDNEEFLKEFEDILEKNNTKYSINKQSESSDHYSFNYRGLDAVTLIQYANDLIHTPLDDINNIDKSRIGEVSDVIISYMNDYAYAASDQYKVNISEKQKQISYVIPIIIAMLIIIVIVFMFIIKKLRKDEKLKEKYLGKSIFTIVIVLIAIISILIFNNYLWDEEIKQISGIAPWRTNVDLLGSCNNIIDVNVKDDITALLGKKDGVYKYIFNSYGKKISNQKITDDINKDFKLLNNDVYYKEDNKIYVLDEETPKLVLDNINSYEVFNVNNKNYITAFNNNEIIIKVDNTEKRIGLKNIKNAAFKIDTSGVIHVVVKQNNQLKHLAINTQGDILLEKELENSLNITDYKLGIDNNYGYLFYNFNEQDYYVSFNIHDKNTVKLKPKELDIHDDYGALLKHHDTISLANEISEGDSLFATINGNVYIGDNYVFLLKFKEGILFRDKVIRRNSKASPMINPMIDQYDNHQYIGWIENNDFMMMSSNVLFGENVGMRTFYNRLYRIVQNFIVAFVTFFYEIFWFVPGIIFFVIWWFIKRDKFLDNVWIVIVPIVLSLLAQIWSFDLPNLIGNKFDYIWISLVIAVIAGIFTLLNKYEKGKGSAIRLYVVFMIINILLVVSIYAPYNYKEGLERMGVVTDIPCEEMILE
ncbi:M28 family metallopeptidase [Abyssisolibacter fermentans]|uniref:M28 family metallopeptidase n=1 Tax=Abyssisolibacter fermentans TaxID=1766203 RepID=UPI0008359ADE|nr:M28 family metallopeptidase [Abyssisolibacter fermentans]